MGKLRIESKNTKIDPKKLETYVQVLQEVALENDRYDHFWNLDGTDDQHTEIQYLMAAASQLKIVLKIRKLRVTPQFHLIIQEQPTDSVTNLQSRLVALLSKVDEPQKKADIQHATGIPHHQWRQVLQPLIKMGKVKAHGATRSQAYSLVKDTEDIE